MPAARTLIATSLAATLLSALVTGVALAQTDPAEYLTEVGNLQVRMDTIATQAVDVNTAWDAREVSFDDTLDAFRSVEAEARGIVDGVRALTPPEEQAAEHASLVTLSEEAFAASTAMISGLQDPNDSEARQLAVDQFTVAATQFSETAAFVVAPPTTTTLPVTTTSITTTTVAATVTTSPPVTAALPEGTAADAPDDSGGSDVATPLLVLIGLLAGLLVGLTGGLLIGRRARRNLVVALQRERAGGPPPAL